MSAAHPMSRLEQVREMPPEGMVPAHIAQEAVREALSAPLPAAIEREMTLRMWAEIGTAHLLVGKPRADDDSPLTWADLVGREEDDETRALVEATELRALLEVESC